MRRNKKIILYITLFIVFVGVGLAGNYVYTNYFKDDDKDTNNTQNTNYKNDVSTSGGVTNQPVTSGQIRYTYNSISYQSGKAIVSLTLTNVGTAAVNPEIQNTVFMESTTGKPYAIDITTNELDYTNVTKQIAPGESLTVNINFNTTEQAKKIFIAPNGTSVGEFTI